MKKNAKDFYAGYAAALANVVRLHDEECVVADVMIGDGVTIATLREADVDWTDLKILRKARLHRVPESERAAWKKANR